MTAEKLVGAKYVMVNNVGYLEGIYAVGTVITLINDDGTAMPLFRNAYGDRYFVRMRDVVQIVGEEPAETKEVPKLKFTELQKDTVYVESDGDYVMIASKPVAGKTLFVQRNFYGKPFIVDNYDDSFVHNDGYIKATEEVAEEFNKLFKQYVLESQQHITEEELAALEAGDKFTLVDYLYEGHDFGAYCNEEMLPNAGKELTFSYHSNTGNAAACEGRWKYSHDMIASVKKAVKTITQEEFDSLEVGDKVTVRADLHTGLAVRNGVVTSMTELAGKTVTVTGLCNGDVKVDGRPQYWSKEMFTAVIKQEKPKFAVGDIVTTDGVLGTADWAIARRVTAVDMETRKYEMEWADGSVSGINSLLPFTEADAFLTHYTGKVPTAAQSHITAEQFAAIKVGDKLKLRTDMEVMDVFGGALVNREMISLAKDGVTPTVEYIDSDATVRAKTDGSAWYYTAEMIAEVISEQEFDCPELVYGNIYTDNDGWTFRYTKTDNKKRGAEVTGGPTIDPNGDYHFSNEGFIHFYKWRKANAEEVAKLEAAEKENGYVPPLVNEVGTVIEAGKYYKIKSTFATECICKVVEVFEAGFRKDGLLVELDGTLIDIKTPPVTEIGSFNGAYAVPATEEQIALYEAVLALRTAQKTFEEATQAVKEVA